MQEQEFITVLKKIKPYTDYIYLHVLGEPLLHPDLLRFLDLAESEGLQVNLTTNGLLLEMTGDALLEKGALRQINISLHSRGGYSAREEQQQYLESMAFYSKRAALKYRKIVSLRLWNAGTSDHDEEVYIQAVARCFLAFFGTEKSDMKNGNDRRGIKLSENVYLNFDNRFSWPVPDSSHEDQAGFCLGLRDQIAVLSDGTVVPCCLDTAGDISLGNLFMQEMEEVLGNPRAKALYQGFSYRKVIEPLCTGCTYKNRFQNR